MAARNAEGPHVAGPRERLNRAAGLRLLGVRPLLRDVELGELVGEAGVAGSGADLLERGQVLVERGPEAAEAVAVAQAELGGDLVAVEQADLVHCARQGLGGLDLDAAVALQAR